MTNWTTENQKFQRWAVVRALAGEAITGDECGVVMFELRIGPNAFRHALAPWFWGRFFMRKAYREAKQ